MPSGRSLGASTGADFTIGVNASVRVTTTAGVMLFTIYTRTEVGSNWAGLQMDNVQLNASVPLRQVPALGGWSLFVLGLLVTLGGMFSLRRR